jgi:hypothetical protein
MKLVFQYPKNTDNLELILATKAYEDIWEQDGKRISELFTRYTGLEFQQDTIKVIVQYGNSWSGYANKPMRLSVKNTSIIEKQNALVHELGHRLLFGNGISTPIDDKSSEEEIRVYLFQGEVLKNLYGAETYKYWANTSSTEHVEEHIQPLKYVLGLTKKERQKKIRQIISEYQS